MAKEQPACPYCGKPLDKEFQALVKKFGLFTCPGCEREGCPECMPSGRGCICPQCEGVEE